WPYKSIGRPAAVVITKNAAKKISPCTHRLPERRAAHASRPNQPRAASSNQRKTMPQMELAISRMLRMRLSLMALASLSGGSLYASWEPACSCGWVVAVWELLALGPVWPAAGDGIHPATKAHAISQSKDQRSRPRKDSSGRRATMRQSSIQMLLPDFSQKVPVQSLRGAAVRPHLGVRIAVRPLAVAAALFSLLPFPAYAASAVRVVHAEKKDASAAQTPVLLDAMTTELHRAFTSLGKTAVPGDDKPLPPYFLSYSVSDASYASIRAQYGAVVDSSGGRV